MFFVILDSMCEILKGLGSLITQIEGQGKNRKNEIAITITPVVCI